MTQQIYNNTAAAGYDQVFAHVSSYFIPFLLRAGRLAPGQHMLDIGTGTGLAAEAALAIVGPAGTVTATDISPDMVDRARQRLAGAPNASVAVEDGQALSFPDESFDTVTCSLGLMFFPGSRARPLRVPPCASCGRTLCGFRQHRARAILQHESSFHHGPLRAIAGTGSFSPVFARR